MIHAYEMRRDLLSVYGLIPPLHFDKIEITIDFNDSVDLLDDSFAWLATYRESFTDQKESQQRLDAQKAAAAKIRLQRDERQRIRDEFYGLFSITDAHKRGKALEGSLNRLFASFDMLAFHVHACE